MVHQNLLSGTLLSLFSFLLFCHQAEVRAQTDYFTFDTCYTPEAALPAGSGDCNLLSNFIPDESTPVRIIRLAFHVLQREAPLPKGNFDENNANDVAFLEGLRDRLNSLYAQCNFQWCNCDYVGGLGHTRNSKIQFELDGIYYHRDNVGYGNGNGTYGSSYNYDNYASCRNEVLNVFFSNPPLKTASGYGPANFVSLFNYYDEYQQAGGGTWGGGNLLGHEIGHTLGLSHSFIPSGQLADMCQSELTNGVGKYCEDRATDCTCGNNVMSYSRASDYFSPLQMATMRRRLTIVEGASKFLKLDLQPTPIYIEQSGVVWDEARIVDSDVHIMPGASLRIECRVVMAENARIVVRRGARLVVDGGVVTSKGPVVSVCNDISKFVRWEGIEVWGNTSVSTSTAMLAENFPLQATDPGVVILKNNALIERAATGIYPQRRGATWEVQLEHFGGLISVDNAEFRNCRTGVAFISHYPLRSSSRFVNAKFTQTYLGTSLPFPLETAFGGVSSWQVKGITFDGCTFQNLVNGIYFLNADFIVKNTLFQRNTRGVYIGATAPGLGLLAEIGDASSRNTFESCAYPISVFAYDLAEIDDNLIRSSPLGIYVEGPSGTIIQNNELRNNTSGSNPEMITGIALTLTGDGPRNLIRCNEWVTSVAPMIRDGILVHGDNRKTLFHDNVFTCKYDVKIVQYQDGQVLIPGSLPDQTLGVRNSVYNLFTSYSNGIHSAEIHTPDPGHSSGQLTLPFHYYHPPGVCPNPSVTPAVLGSQYIPRRPGSGTCSGIFPTAYNFTNVIGSGGAQATCPVQPRPILVLDAECKTPGCLEDLYPAIAQVASVLGGGDAGSLYTYIHSDPNGLTTLNALAASSPYLSDGVLQAILSSATMTETNKRNVLAQNIPLAGHILALAEQVLSQQAYAYILGLYTTGMKSVRDSLRGDFLTLTNHKNALLRHLVDSLTAIDEYEDADDLLAADGSRFARETRVGLMMAQGDHAAAKQFLSGYPVSESTDAEFKAIQSLYLDYVVYGALPSYADSVSLLDIALESPWQAARAKALAGALYGMMFDPLLPNDEKEQAFMAPPLIHGPAALAVAEPAFDIRPNPVRDAVQVYLNHDVWLAGEKISIRIYDIRGALLLTQDFTVSQPEINIASLQQGLYFISAHCGDQHLGAKRFVKL